MTNLQDLERRLRERHDYLYKGSCIPSCITEAADIIQKLAKLEPALYWHCKGHDNEQFVEPEAVNAPCDECLPLYSLEGLK